MRNGFTLVKLGVVVAIIFALLGLLSPAFSAARDAAKSRREKGEPPETWRLRTVTHDKHLWVISDAVATVPAIFCHHPDCPCHKKAERE